MTEKPDTSAQAETEKAQQADAAKTAQPEADSGVPPEKTKGRRWLLISLFAVLGMAVLALGALGGLFYYGKTQFEAAGPLTVEKQIQFRRGTGLIQIARQLEQEGAITDARIFRFGVQLQNEQRNLKAGEYAIPAGASMADIMALLKSGKAILHRLTVPEGITVHEAMTLIEAHPVLVGDLPETPQEGSLLPETYLFERGTTRKEIVAQMQTALSDALQDYWAKRAPNLPLKTPQEALILASIVEKETGIAAERPQVASVFINRLNRPMRLQSDPTIIYGITLGKSQLGRGLRRSEIDRKTPYNTYQIDGLPPTPIALVGPDALAAVLNPPTTPYFYFVADGTGGHVFAKTLREHQANVRNWRRIERQRR